MDCNKDKCILRSNKKEQISTAKLLFLGFFIPLLFAIADFGILINKVNKTGVKASYSFFSVTAKEHIN